MYKTLVALLFLASCGIKPNSPPVTGKTCETEANCARGQFCALLPGGNMCKDRCDNHSECGTDFKCEAGQCKACEVIGCGEFGDGGTGGEMGTGAAGCKSGVGRVVSATMHACPGTFNGNNEAAKLCASGWSWCTSNIAGADCENNLPRTEFYVANAPQGQNQPAPWQNSGMCAWNGIQRDNSLRGVPGCGNGIAILEGIPTVTPCGGFSQTARCWEMSAVEQSGPFTCPYLQGTNADMQEIRNTEPVRFGVLCCRN